MVKEITVEEKTTTAAAATAATAATTSPATTAATTTDGLSLSEAFGTADESFAGAIDRALTEIKEQSDEVIPPVVRYRRSIRLVVAAALACGLLAASLAIADEYRRGVLDFFSGNGGTGTDKSAIRADEAAELLVDVSENEAAQTDWARFELDEYLYDGRRVYATIRVTATSDDILLLTPGYGGAKRPVQDMASMKPYYAAEQQSIADYVATNELRAYRVEFDGGPPSDRFDGSHTSAGMTQSWDDAGRLTLMISIPLEPGEKEIALRFNMYPVDLKATEPYTSAENAIETELHAESENAITAVIIDSGGLSHAVEDLVDDQEAKQTVTLTMNVDDTTSEAAGVIVLGLAEPIVFEEYGITIDGVRLTLSPLVSYLMIYGTVDDEERLMADGRPGGIAAPMPVISFGPGEEPQSWGFGIDENGRYIVEAELPAFNEFPRDMTLTFSYGEEFYSPDEYPQAASWRPETHTLTLIETK
jgi:hypothetical protein